MAQAITRRERLRQSTIEEIKAHARQQMAAEGSATLSLNAIARSMGVSGPALYRYFANRDELITALILDAYNAQADALAETEKALSLASAADRLWAVLMCYRQWALDHPTEFALIYGTPIPGYHAPEESTKQAAQRTFEVILRLLVEAFQTGQITFSEGLFKKSSDLVYTIPGISETNMDFPTEIIYLGISGWCRIHGIIMLELFNHTTALLKDPHAFYQHEVTELLSAYGMSPPKIG